MAAGKPLIDISRFLVKNTQIENPMRSGKQTDFRVSAEEGLAVFSAVCASVQVLSYRL